ncbi:uncharacterized protein LOC142787020 [Rhipicephalus microplus]|uniref:uncharacterized protein LOC142787020 n=1 Tax=Rhipicephalus microplus TaxID=6941 RepID=UPI003F6D4964
MASNPNVSVVEGMDINPGEAECAGWIEVASKKKKLAERADCNAGNAPTSATGSDKGGSRTAASQNVLRRVVKASRIPNLPRDHFKTIIRPRGGMDVKKTDLLIFKRSLAKAASLTAEQVLDDTLCTNPFQNIFVVATPFEANARAYARVQEISMGSTVIGLAAYVAASDNTCKGVIRGINVDLSDAELTEMIVNRRNPDALGVRRIKKTPTVIVLFDGQKVPQHVVCDGVRYPCSLYRSSTAMGLGLRLLICIFFVNVVAATAQKSNFSTICFWDGFSRWRRRPYNSVVSDIPAEACSAVVYSHVTVDDKSGWIRLTDEELELDPQAKSNANSWMYYPMWLLPPNKVFAQMGNLKRRNSKLKLLLAVGGPHESVEKYWQLFSKAHLWKDMAGSLVKWLKTYEFDGVVLDFFSGAGSLHDSFRNWDNAKFIHPFLKIDRAEFIALRGAPREKIVLEIPLSGRTYTAVAAPSGDHTVYPGHSGPYTKLQGFLAFFEVCSHIKSGWRRERFGEEACSFLKLGDEYVAYEDDESISRKARMVMGRQYHGAAVRSVDLGDYKGDCKEKSFLLKALRSTLDITEYYVHFYFNPPNTTWWKEIEEKHATTELPSGSTFSAERNTTPSQTSSEAQGELQNRPTIENLRLHTPFVPHIPAQEGKLSTTPIASSSSEDFTARKLPEAHSTPKQATPTPAKLTAATDKTTAPPSSAWNILGSIFQKLFPPSVTTPSSATITSAPPTPKSTEPQNTPKVQGPPTQTASLTARPTTATDESPGPPNSAWNIIGSIYQKLFPQFVSSPAPLTTSTSSAPAKPKGQTMKSQNTPEVHSTTIQSASTTEQATAATDKRSGPQNSAWNLIGSIFQELFPPSVTTSSTSAMTLAPPTYKSGAMEPQNTLEIQGPHTQTSLAAQPTPTTGKSPGPQNSAWNIIGNIFQKFFLQSVTSSAPPTTSTPSTPATPKGLETTSQNAPEVSTTIQAVSPTEQATTATDKSSGPQNSAWNLIGSIFQELFPPSVTSPVMPTSSSAPPTDKRETTKYQSTPDVQSTLTQVVSPTAQPTTVTHKSTDPKHSALKLIGDIFQELLPQSVTSPASLRKPPALPAPTDEMSLAPPTTIRDSSVIKTQASSQQTLMSSVLSTTAEASPVRPTTSSDLTAQGDTPPAPPMTLPFLSMNEEETSAQPMPPSVPTTTAGASSVQPTMTSDALTTQSQTSDAPLTTLSTSISKVKASTAQPTTPPVRTTTAGTSSVQPTKTSDTPTAKSETSDVPPTTLSTPMSKVKASTVQPMTPPVLTTTAGTSSVQPTKTSDTPTAKSETSDAPPTTLSTPMSKVKASTVQPMTPPVLTTTAGTSSVQPTKTSDTPTAKSETSDVPPTTLSTPMSKVKASTVQPMTSPVLITTGDASSVEPTTTLDPPTAKNETSPAPLTTLSTPMTKVKASSAQPMTPAVPTTTVEASSIQPTTTSDPPTAKGETSPAPLTTLSTPMTKVKASSAQPMTPAVLTTTAEASSVQPATTSDPPTVKTETSPAPLTVFFTPVTKVKALSGQPMTQSVPTTTADASSVQPTTTSDPPTARSETSLAPLATLSTPMTKEKASSAQPWTPSVPTATSEALSRQPTTISDPPTAKGETSPASLTMPSTSTITKAKSSSAQPMTSISTTMAETFSAESTASSKYPMPKVTTSSTQHTASLKSATFKAVPSSPPPASPTALADHATPATVARTNEGGVCKGAEDNKLLPHDSDCTKFYQCSHSRSFLQDCPQGTIFDIQRQICNWSALANRPECI